MVVRARDVMTTRVVSVSPGTSLDHVRYVLTENRFSALPVVDDRYRLVGIVTTFDLLRADTESAERPPSTVAEVMTRKPLTMAPDAPITIIAHRMREYGELRAMPIVERGVLAGVVTRADLLETGPVGGPAGRLFRRLGGRERPRFTRRNESLEVRSGPTAADVMTPRKDVKEAWETLDVAKAITVLQEHRFTALPVIDGGDHLVGILSEADLVPDTLSGRRTPFPRTVGQAMTRDVVRVHGTDPVATLADTMVARRLRLLPVVDHDDRLLGVVSRGDLLRATATPPS
jgi:CBS domain-containing protein